MRFWANIAAYQLVWFCAVLGAARGQAWPGIAAALLFSIIHLYTSPSRRSDARLIGCALLAGLLIDGGLGASGWAHYAADQSDAFAPLWILAIWLAFALTLNHSSAWLQGRPLLGVALGVFGGPLAYLAAERLHAIAFIAPAWRGLLWLALAWAVAMPLLAAAAARWRHTAGRTPLSGAST
ncbi:uncharacterized protein DUF2878 [Tahibacter aquaticus]|uniref:Uncharacterized protein DUF2878 n=1 Tax=Tahibacter aquaticus TaxID=520092 RepID=A0A4V3DMZ9_9GAMM|nr:DUF2878 domain-containing protein [Tahibacter aquaticus]TDR45846.1 uncharacterized protein DUF2878 [Tahibacter aquaticus]